MTATDVPTIPAIDQTEPDGPAEEVRRVSTFEGDRITRSSVKITKAGDGLSDALKIETVAMHRGDKVFFVLEGEVRHVAFPPDGKDSDTVMRQHVIDTVSIAIVTETDVRELLDHNAKRVEAGLAELQAAKDSEGTIFDPEHGAVATQDAIDALDDEDGDGWEDPETLCDADD